MAYMLPIAVTTNVNVQITLHAAGKIGSGEGHAHIYEKASQAGFG